MRLSTADILIICLTVVLVAVIAHDTIVDVNWIIHR